MRAVLLRWHPRWRSKNAAGGGHALRGKGGRKSPGVSSCVRPPCFGCTRGQVVGIIDYMRQYDMIKRMERMGKSVSMIAGQAEPTIVQPSQYRARFQQVIGDDGVVDDLALSLSGNFRCLFGFVGKTWPLPLPPPPVRRRAGF